jgi:hypothetical protein
VVVKELREQELILSFQSTSGRETIGHANDVVKHLFKVLTPEDFIVHTYGGEGQTSVLGGSQRIVLLYV